MDIKSLFSDKDAECKLKSPWIIEEITNGLRVKNVKIVGGIIAASNKKVPIQYFEYDRILGQGAFSSVLKVMEMFDELKVSTPKTIGYIYKENIYLNYDKGILKRNTETGDEEFYSEESLRNRNIDDYLQLNSNPESHDEADTDRSPLLSESTELQTTAP